MSDSTLQDLLAQLAAATDPAEKAAITAESVLSDSPAETAIVARRCIILHWFDREVIAALLPEQADEAPATVYQQLAALPFIESLFGERLAYHELTRQGLLQRYASTQPDWLVAAAGLAAPVYAAQPDETITHESRASMRRQGRSSFRPLQPGYNHVSDGHFEPTFAGEEHRGNDSPDFGSKAGTDRTV